MERLNSLNFLARLRFTLIISEDEDNAFAFFDSQNTRGVTLGADDFLKAYHLREVQSEELQEALAQDWETAVLGSQKEKNYEFGLEHLFYKILYRARMWKGQSNLRPGDKDSILWSFQKKTLVSPNKDVYELFPGRGNQRYKFLFQNDRNTIRFISEESNSQDALDWPFIIRQPIFKGHNFFKYTQKYHRIHKCLFFEENVSERSVISARNYYNSIYTENMSVYLRHYMQLCLVMYYDVFRDARIEEAIKYFDYLIGSIRISKYYVKKESVKNSLTGKSNNLLDVIASAFVPEEIFEFIGMQKDIKEIYEEDKLDDDKGVRTLYKKRVLAYFKRSGKTLKNRLEWIQ